MSKIYRQAARAVNNGEIAPIYLITGDEEWGKRKFLDLLKAKLIDPSMEEFNFDLVQANEISGVAVVDKAGVLPMMADRRMIIARECEKWNAKDHKALSEYAKQPNEQTCLVLIFGTVDKRKGLFRSRAKTIANLAFDRPKPWELKEYLGELTRDMKLKLTPDALDLLAEMVGDDLAKAHGELEKLSLYKLGSQQIDESDVAALLGRTRHVTRWELNEFVGKRDLAGALIKMHDILDSGEEPLGLLSTLSMHLKQLFMVKALAARGARDASQVARAIGLPPRIAGGLLEQQRRYSGFELRRAFTLLKETDIRLKSAAMDRRLILDQLVTQILLPGPDSPPSRSGSGR